MIDDVHGRWSPARDVSTSDAERLSDDDTDCVSRHGSWSPHAYVIVVVTLVCHTSVPGEAGQGVLGWDEECWTQGEWGKVGGIYITISIG